MKKEAESTNVQIVFNCVVDHTLPNTASKIDWSEVSMTHDILYKDTKNHIKPCLTIEVSLLFSLSIVCSASPKAHFYFYIVTSVYENDQSGHKDLSFVAV